jgi:hypothetical protein
MGWLAAGATLGVGGWLVTDGEPARAEATAGFESSSSLVAATKKPNAASVSEGGGGFSSFSFLTPEYRRNVFFVYEKRLRLMSPPEKVFDYFSSVKSREGTFMTSLDLMRAAVPVFQPVDSPHVRSGFLGGERRDGDEQSGGAAGAQDQSQSDFFKLFDIDGRVGTFHSR